MEIDQAKGLVHSWAAAHPIITKVWIYGSRARGTHRDDSDLDVAVQVRGDYTIDEQFSVWMSASSELQVSLQSLLPILVQLEWYGNESETEIIHSGIAEGSLLVYER